MGAGVGASGPGVELGPVVEVVGEAPGGLEVGAHEAVRALERSLGLGVASVEDDPADPELAAEGGKALGRLPAAAVDRRLAIPDQLLGQAPQPLEAAAHPQAQIRELLREDQRRGERARVAELGRHHPAAAQLAVADRDRPRGLPEIELAQLAGPVDRALVGAQRQVAGADLAHVVVDDRLGAVKAQLGDQLADPLRGDAGLSAQQLGDLAPERIELARPRRA